jgi:hypothetical protein
MDLAVPRASRRQRAGMTVSWLAVLSRAVRVRLGRSARRQARRARRAGERLRMRWPALVGRVEHDGVYFVVSKIPRGDDPRSQAILGCARKFADSGVPVHLLVLEFERDVDSEVDRLKQDALPRLATVKCFWRDAAPSGDGGGFPDTLRDVPQTAISVVTPGHPGRTTYFNAGLPIATVTELQRGLEVEHLAPDGAPIRRDDYDERRRLVRMLELRPDTGRVAMHRYVDSDGTCWMSAWVNPSSGQSGPLQVYSPTPMELATYGDVQARWISREIHRSATALVVSDDAASGRVVAKSHHPAAIRMAVAPDSRPVRAEDLLAFYRRALTPVWRRGRSSMLSPPAPLRLP